ncbi:MAG TPA: Fis family transcriptional regulator, partial [Clostridiaceae bacterium]|nr:Fis family transcriptional regulator [Clostridiaceae bacterium]
AELKNSIIKLFEEEVNKGEIIIDILNPDNIEAQGRILKDKGAKAIIARSGGYRHTVGNVNIPVINLKITTLDILYAIKTASKFKKDIVLVISDLEFFDYDEWKDMISARIMIERFCDKEDIEAIVKKYEEQKEGIAIVGGGIPCTYAKRLGIVHVPIGASNESIYEGVAYARELIDNLYEQNYKNEVLKTTLDGVHDAVVAINQEGKIILFNERAQELLNKRCGGLIDKKLLDVCPELDFMMEILKSNINRYDEIKKLKRITIAANTSILNVDGHIHGVLCSFMDITKLQSLEKEIRYELNKKGLVAKYRFQDIIANEPAMKQTVEKAIKIGLSDSTVLIYGESGTGKEMIAQSIHNISSRKDEPFVAVNCAALSESLLESELFGYEEGAFTGAKKGGKIGLFELAHGGTIFLDEVGEMPLSLQGRLLRVLQEREVLRVGGDYILNVDIRVIAATNLNLYERVKEGKFREDLYFRLNILDLRLPALRERKEDIPLLLRNFIREMNAKHDTKIKDIEESGMELLKEYNWPGNIRQLENFTEKMCILSNAPIINESLIEQLLGNGLYQKKAPKAEKEKQGDTITLDIGNLKDIELQIIKEASKVFKGDKILLAEKLGMSRTTLWKRLKEIEDMEQ